MIGLGHIHRRALVAILIALVFIYYRVSTRAAINPPGVFPKPQYTPGASKSVDYEHTRTLVIARTSSEDVSWIEEELGSSSSLQTAIYTVDSPIPPFTVPKNKGREVMPYLTYIITHYHNLSDVTIFMHASPVAWHNNDLLDDSSPMMLRALSSHKVVRDGYFNLRCHQSPGCSDQVHHLGAEFGLENPKLAAFATAWSELLPARPMPKVLRQPCCSQFAVSRERIQALLLEQYEFFRDWVLATELTDALSGRVWEYLWQYIWTGQPELCPEVHICYCDGFRLCFGGEEQYKEYISLGREKGNLERVIEDDKRIGNQEAQKLVQAPKRIVELNAKMTKVKEEAFERGRDPKKRAAEVGRPWKEGDGY
ncbi:uncharacterized protein BDZ99DRAFT_439666 [Mytilinidion resinicola]|uniref:Uncharacterized protein n=1 Tax=Mytilinidion resinicola TaxID=574789 RepID=A0A6A6YUP0_9PEZI|nr:uncharacterized protein BDZ99DRAFT_439666 [Mytilinidion resinicola]KAF2812491.1 hypothetical protein BDZ99DRAFT_439666 [Mytilinidion resinicola]